MQSCRHSKEVLRGLVSGIIQEEKSKLSLTGYLKDMFITHRFELRAKGGVLWDDTASSKDNRGNRANRKMVYSSALNEFLLDV